MAGFYGTFENKVDQKGRVSVPAPFRQNLNVMAAFPSHRAEAIEGCTMDYMEQLSGRVSEIELFSETHDDLAFTVFSDTLQLTFDSTGRIQLSEGLRAHAGISDRAAFVGLGHMFQIWEPAKLVAHKAAARARAREKKITLPSPGNSSDGGSR
ncbi:MAG: cell division/cell wall cluster transcriptional repressor MraZ [Kiloniellaceae bacterium]